MKDERLVQGFQQKQLRPDQVIAWPDPSNAALLIDGENASPKPIVFIDTQARRLGEVTTRRVYGNWLSGQLSGWGRILLPYDLERYHHRSVAPGKNATDIAISVDAMHLYSQGVRRFCIVTSDSDFTPLVEWLCEQGCLVLVLGKATTPIALRQACSAFFLIDSPTPSTSPCTHQLKEPDRVEKLVFSEAKPAPMQKTASLATILSQEQIAHEQLKVKVLTGLTFLEPSPYAWIQVPRLREHLKGLDSDFRSKKHGYKNILVLLQAFPTTFQLRPYQGQTHVHEVRRVEM